MGELIERIKLNNLVYGSSIVDCFKNNSLFFYDKYRKSDKDVTNVPISRMKSGHFYFLHYKDDSNWMQYSPIFAVDIKQFGNIMVLHGINFNFIPLEVRSTIFDKFITSDDFDNDKGLKVNYEGVYTELLKYGFEYALVEYAISQIFSVHQIKMSLVPRFLYSQHPINIYDPNKLYSIWKVKLETKDKRNREMMNLFIKDLYNASEDILENYEQLKSHIARVQSSFEKYGK